MEEGNNNFRFSFDQIRDLKRCLPLRRIYSGFWKDIQISIKKYKLEYLSQDHLKNFQIEAARWKDLRHPNIVRVMGACVDEGNIAIATEYIAVGSLFQYLHREEIPLSRQLQILTDIAEGIEFLHSNSIVHGNLKSSNILLDANYRAKITDFGIPSIEILQAKNYSNVRWMAPELLQKPKPQRLKESDIWSYGMIMWEMFSKKIPFQTEPSDFIVMNWIKEGTKEEIPSDCPTPIYSLIYDCWESNLKIRPSPKKIVSILKCVDDFELAKVYFWKGNATKAKMHFQKSIDLGWKEGLVYFRFGILGNVAEAEKELNASVDWFIKEEQKGSTQASINLALCQLNIDILREYAEAGFPLCQFFLAFTDFATNLHSSLGYLQAMTDKSTHGYGAFLLGMYYLQEDIDKGRKFFENSAEHGNVLAKAHLALLNLGIIPKCSQNIPKFKELVEDLIKKEDLSLAYDLYGMYHFLNIDGTGDQATGINYFMKGKEGVGSLSNYFLGISYFSGVGVKRDRKIALDYFLRYSSQIDSATFLQTFNDLQNVVCYHIGRCYMEGGDGISQDLKESARWFKKVMTSSSGETLESRIGFAECGWNYLGDIESPIMESAVEMGEVAMETRGSIVFPGEFKSQKVSVKKVSKSMFGDARVRKELAFLR